LAQASLGYLLQLFNLEKENKTFISALKAEALAQFSGIAAYGFINHLRGAS
jgi:hypothetical protein